MVLGFSKISLGACMDRVPKICHPHLADLILGPWDGDDVADEPEREINNA